MGGILASSAHAENASFAAADWLGLPYRTPPGDGFGPATGCECPFTSDARDDNVDSETQNREMRGYR